MAHLRGAAGPSVSRVSQGRHRSSLPAGTDHGFSVLLARQNSKQNTPGTKDGREEMYNPPIQMKERESKTVNIAV